MIETQSGPNPMEEGDMESNSQPDDHASRQQLRSYVWTYLALCGLASLSFALAELPRAGMAIALLIAAVKAVLVMAYFMHLAEETFTFKVVMAAAGSLVVILVLLTAMDPLTRVYPPAPSARPDLARNLIGVQPAE